MSYFRFSIPLKTEKWNLKIHISIFRATLKTKSEILKEKFNFPFVLKPRSGGSISYFSEFVFSISKKSNYHLGKRIGTPVKLTKNIIWIEDKTRCNFFKVEQLT